MKIFFIIVCVVALVVIALKLFVRSHVKWLTKQTPVGVWATQHNGSTITIGFEQGPNEELKEGIYKQVERSRDGKEIKEFGHWMAHMNNLQMLIMTSEIKNHPRFGQDTAYQVLYVGPQ